MPGTRTLARSLLPAALCTLLVALSGCESTGPGGGLFGSPRRVVSVVGREPDLPPVPREFRGVWVASVANIDWPSRPGLSPAQQQTELLQLLDQAASLQLNAVVLQVRPMCDALYESRLEPWSEYLTGVSGRSPGYDPLAFAVRAAHERGLELHAWFNPFRARHKTSSSAPDPLHLTRSRPDWIRAHGKQLWLDPGLRDVQQHVLSVIADVVKRYDVDGVHLDDYFSPYPDAGAGPFPDESTFDAYRRRGGRLALDDWRRDNVNRFVAQLYRTVKSLKPHVKVGISPFGIWRPGHPPQIQGMDAFGDIYADSRLWLQRGWVDYLSPQLYWRFDQAAQSFPVLLAWWAQQNSAQRKLWPGLIPSRVGEGAWNAAEIERQWAQTRSQRGVDGALLFSAVALTTDRGGVASALRREMFRGPALSPVMPWIDRRPPPPPELEWLDSSDGRRPVLAWRVHGGDPPAAWVLRIKDTRGWQVRILPRTVTRLELPPARPELLALSAVDRAGNLSAPAVWR